jgi:hypothetical protein
MEQLRVPQVSTMTSANLELQSPLEPFWVLSQFRVAFCHDLRKPATLVLVCNSSRTRMNTPLAQARSRPLSHSFTY